MWIEQLATKRDKLGAAKTIAVASSRFSESAIRTAALMGIELRTLRDITADDISSWVPKLILNNVFLHTKLRRMYAIIEGPNGGTFELERDSELRVRALVRAADGAYISPYELLKLGLSQQPVVGTFPCDGSKALNTLTLALPYRALQVQSPTGLLFITSLSFDLECHQETKLGSVTATNVYEYAGLAGSPVQRAEIVTEVEGGIPMVLGLQRVSTESPVQVTVSWQKTA